jgi:hypothetical protein
MLSSLYDHSGKERDLVAITSNEIPSFLSKITEGGKQQTKHGRYSHLKAFFNFIKTNNDARVVFICRKEFLSAWVFMGEVKKLGRYRFDTNSTCRSV